MKVVRSLLLLVAVLALSACGPSTFSQSPLHHSRGQQIIGGTLTTGDPAVVILAVGVTGGYEDYCSGTLIGPRTVLTAAHCIDAYTPQDTYYVLFGSSVTAPSNAVRFAQQLANPSYHGGTSDFGMVKLETPVTVTPIAMNQTAIDSAWIGRSIRHVGFGVDNAGAQSGSGVKREVTYTLRAVHAMEIESGASGKQTCNGDSGGPAFMVPAAGGPEQLVGVVSWGDYDCAVEGWDGRVDAVQPWVRQTMATWETPTCAFDGACVAGCTPVDQDCACAADGVCSPDCLDAAHDPDCPRDCGQNGVCSTQACPHPDPDCVATGGTCTSAQLCVSRLCVTDAQHPQTYCSRACTPGGDGCPTGMECAGGQCQFIAKPAKQLTDYCAAQTDYCVQSICDGPAGGATRCVKSCVGTSDCGANSTCEGGADGQRYCRPAGLAFTPPVVTLDAMTELRQPVARSCSSTGALPFLLSSLLVLLRTRRVRA